MSDRQWAGMMLGDEAYAGSRNFYHLEEAVREIYGYKHLVPTHQGRGAEHILSQILIKPGDVVPGNMYFTTTRLHQELAGGSFVDVIIDEAHDPASEHPFKGDVDLGKLERVSPSTAPRRSPTSASPPRSTWPAASRSASPTCARCASSATRHGIRIIHDATRVAENAYFIKEREPGYADRTIAEIVREICDLTDGCTMSAKKDALVNIGGFLALNDDDLFDAARNMVVVYEGLHTYGGMAGRDMEAVAIGLHESVDFEHIKARVGQVLYLGREAPGVRRADRRARSAATACSSTPRPSCRTSTRSVYPAQALAAELYLDSGVRAMERGTVSAGRDPETGQDRRPKLELVRLTVPRRVYTQAHMDVVAESVAEVYDHRDEVKGLRMTYEPRAATLLPGALRAGGLD